MMPVPSDQWSKQVTLVQPRPLHDRRDSQVGSGLRKVCESYLRGQYDVEVVHIYRGPVLAKDDQSLAKVTLVKMRPYTWDAVNWGGAA
jgi:KaiB-like protein